MDSPESPRPDRFSGHTVLVTGAATGIGEAICRHFAAAGARVAVTDRNGDGARTLAAALPHEAAGWQLDVTKRRQTEEVFAEAVQTFGKLDVVIANAGVSTMNPVTDLTEDEWDLNMNVNAKGIFLTNQTAIRYFRREGRPGTIVNTASMAAKIGAPFLAHYSASKFAVVGFTQAVAQEVAEHGIRVNAVCPGYVMTSMQVRELVWEAELRGITPEAVRELYLRDVPLGRLETPDDVAKVVLFLASSDAAYMTGQAINVTGGARMD